MKVTNTLLLFYFVIYTNAHLYEIEQDGMYCHQGSVFMRQFKFARVMNDPLGQLRAKLRNVTSHMDKGNLT